MSWSILDLCVVDLHAHWGRDTVDEVGGSIRVILAASGYLEAFYGHSFVRVCTQDAL